MGRKRISGRDNARNHGNTELRSVGRTNEIRLDELGEEECRVVDVQRGNLIIHAELQYDFFH